MTGDGRYAMDELEIRLRSWMEVERPAQAPSGLYEAIVSPTRTIRQGTWWMRPSMTRRASATLGLVALLLIAMITATIVASRLLGSPDPGLPTGRFLPAGAMPPAISDRDRPAIALLLDGRVLVAGGDYQGLRTGIVYDPATRTFGKYIQMQDDRSGATATTLLDGRVLVVGGTAPSSGLDRRSAELFDPTTGAFERTGYMGAARLGHTATLLADGRVLVTGGLDEGTPDGNDGIDFASQASADVYDPTTGTFEPVGPMTLDRTGHTATRLRDGRVLITGGASLKRDGTATTSASAELFDPQTGTFVGTGTMATARDVHTATLMPDGRVLVVGGARIEDAEDHQFPSGTIASAELFDPAMGAFTTIGSINTERARHAATLLPDGRLLVTGGDNRFGLPLSAELFDPSSGRFTVGPMAAHPHQAGALLLPDGLVFLPGDAAWAELFDPTAEPPVGPAASAPAPTVGAPAGGGSSTPVSGATMRSDHSSTLLSDGRVLIAGGFGGMDNGPLASTEIFDPRDGSITAGVTMTTTRTGHIATLLADGRVLIAGGDPWDGRTAEVIDPVAGTVGPADDSIKAALVHYRAVDVPGLRQGSVLLSSGGLGVERVALLDADTGQVGPWVEPCTARHRHPDVALRDGRILVLCGTQAAQIVDLATGTSTPTSAHGVWATGLALDDGLVVLANEAQSGDMSLGYLEVTAVYQPATDTLTTLSADVPPARGAALASLGDRVVLVGGDGPPLDLLGVYDPAEGTTSPPVRLLTPRERPTVTRLPDGRMLVVGGAIQPPDRNVPVPPAVEIVALP